MKQLLSAAAVAMGILAFAATSVSAASLCRDAGACWHTHTGVIGFVGGGAGGAGAGGGGGDNSS